jgi:hypothetical protein
MFAGIAGAASMSVLRSIFFGGVADALIAPDR